MENIQSQRQKLESIIKVTKHILKISKNENMQAKFRLTLNRAILKLNKLNYV